MKRGEEILAIDGAYIERSAALRAIEAGQQEVLGEAAAIADRVAKECASDARRLQADGDNEHGCALASGGQIEAERIAKLIRSLHREEE